MSSELRRAVRTIARLARVLDCALGHLSLPQYRVLAAVDDGGERASALAAGLALAKPTVTAVVDGLVERGYLVREPVPADRRALRIALTPRGRHALQRAEEAMVERLQLVLEAEGADGSGSAVGAEGPEAPVPSALAALARLAPALERTIGGPPR